MPLAYRVLFCFLIGLLTRPLICGHISSHPASAFARSSLGNPRRSFGYASGFLSPVRTKSVAAWATSVYLLTAGLVIPMAQAQVRIVAENQDSDLSLGGVWGGFPTDTGGELQGNNDEELTNRRLLDGYLIADKILDEFSNNSISNEEFRQRADAFIRDSHIPFIVKAYLVRVYPLGRDPQHYQHVVSELAKDASPKDREHLTDSIMRLGDGSSKEEKFFNEQRLKAIKDNGLTIDMSEETGRQIACWNATFYTNGALSIKVLQRAFDSLKIDTSQATCEEFRTGVTMTLDEVMAHEVERILTEVSDGLRKMKKSEVEELQRILAELRKPRYFKPTSSYKERQHMPVFASGEIFLVTTRTGKGCTDELIKDYVQRHRERFKKDLADCEGLRAENPLLSLHNFSSGATFGETIKIDGKDGATCDIAVSFSPRTLVMKAMETNQGLLSSRTAR